MTFKPAPAHNPLKAPAVCLCADCSRYVLDLRCVGVDHDGRRCGDYTGHRGDHSLIVSTTFQIAEQRST